jgi:hypothetical protein
VPCGRAEELEALADLVKDHPRCLIMSDEIYEYIWFEDPPVSMASLPGMFERTITINGVSKGFAMTGWRVGYAAAPEPVARAIAKVQGTFTAGGNAFAQAGALAAITGPRDEVDQMRSSYKRRRDLAVAMLKGIKGVERNRPSSDLLCAGRHHRPARPHRRQHAHRNGYRVLPLAAGRVSMWPPCRARPSAHRAASACQLPHVTAISPRAWSASHEPPTHLRDPSENTPPCTNENPPAPGPWRERVRLGLGQGGIRPAFNLPVVQQRPVASCSPASVSKDILHAINGQPPGSRKRQRAFDMCALRTK